MAARTAGAWNEKLDAYGAGRSAEVRAPESVSITVDGVTTTRNLSSEAFGWATATETLGFAEAVHHFLDRTADRRPPLTSGRDAVATQKLLDHILTAAGLPDPRTRRPRNGQATPRTRSGNQPEAPQLA